ncbi:MAG: sugar ABC transporter permease [Anaerolineales bacterium]|nr:sugar ABC transporter permease [Anaerolineales bacterium]
MIDAFRERLSRNRRPGSHITRPPRSLRQRQNLWAWIFLAPALVFFVTVLMYPTLRAFYISLFRWPLGAEVKTFVGIENYAALPHDALFLKSIKNTFLFAAGFIAPEIVLSMGLAILLNRKTTRLRGLFRLAFFIPVVSSSVAISFVWKWLFEPSQGLINYLLGFFQISPLPWLMHPKTALLSVIIVTIWQTMGFDVVIFSAGLQTIPNDFYDAAKVDGANAWQQILRITLPLLSPTTVLVITMDIIWALQVFTTVYLMTGGGTSPPGGPLNSTRTMVLHIYQVAFRSLRLGEGAAVSVVLFFIILIVTIIQMRLSRKSFEY